MPTRLHLTSGQGPVECRMAIAHVLKRMAREAHERGIEIDVAEERDEDGRGPQSALVLVTGDDAEMEVFAAHWKGSLLWICQSPVRRHHKRKNWYIACQQIDLPGQPLDQLDPGEVRYEAFRAGGPGGQHQNKTESAIRATHAPSGLSVVVRENRSQHRNKSIALERLQTLVETAEAVNAATDRARLQAAHAEIVRGNPKRTFRGEKFREDS